MTDEAGHICATTDVEEFAEGMAEFDFPEGFDFERQSEYRIVDGELVHDPPEPTEEEPEATLLVRQYEQLA